MNTIEKQAAPIARLTGTISSLEREARIELAACYRLLAHYGMSDLIANHISMRVPGDNNAFLINPYGLLYEEITASSLIKLDHRGSILEKPDFGHLDYGVNQAGFVIHSAIHQARPDVACVIHTHTWAGMAVSTLECGLLPLTQTAMRFASIGYHRYQGVVLDAREQESLAKDLAGHSALVLHNHGLLSVGKTVAEAFNTMHRLELSCKTQLAAMACGTPLIAVEDKVVNATYDNFHPQTQQPFGVRDWPALLRMLDRIDPGFRD